MAHARSSSASWSGSPVALGVGGGEPDLEDIDRSLPAVRDVVDHDVLARLRIERQVLGLDEHAVAVDLEPALGRVEVEVRNPDERRLGQGRGIGPDGERDDRLVVAVAADGQDVDRGVDLGRGRARERAVGGDEDLGVAGAPGELRGELQRITEVAGRAGRPQVVDRLANAAEVARLVGHDPRRAFGGDHADDAAGRQLLERLDRRRLGPLEPVRQDVGRAHARGRVDDEDDVAREPGGPLEERPRGEQHEDQDEQELEQQQEAPTEPLPGRVRLDVREQAGPQQRGRHHGLVAPQLEHVHRDDRGDEQQPEQREGVEQRHVPATRGPGAGGARRTSARRGSCRRTGRRSSPVDARRGPRSPASRPQGASCTRRACRGRR